MDYLLKASGLVILLFLFYQLFLKNETFFKSIRSYFLIGLLIVISLPLIEIPIYVEYVSQQINFSNFETTGIQEVTVESFNWIALLKTIYLTGIVFFSIKFIVQLISLTKLIVSHKAKKQGKYFYIETDKDISPFSFFNYIVFNNQQFTTNELEQIINHEKAHAIQWHSLDTLLAHVLVIVLWFNPFVWLYKKAVQQNLEFLADSYALKLTNNEKFYQLTLIKAFQQNYCAEITNNFYNSLIKKRITMLHKNKSTTKSQWKYALLIPFLTAFIFAFNTKTIAQEKEVIEVIEVEETPEVVEEIIEVVEFQEVNTDFIISKDSNSNDLEKISSIAKENGLSISFKGVKRNNANEITAIKVSAKKGDNQTKFENSGNSAIKPIKISFNDDNNSLSISSVTERNTFTFKSDGEKPLKTVSGKKGSYVFVSSNGDKKTWTSKKGKKVIVEGFHFDEENDKDVKKSKIIDGDTIYMHSNNIKYSLNIDKDNASENVYIIKNEDGKIIQKKNKKNVLVFNSDHKNPLYIVDGKKMTKIDGYEINPYNIENISILKDGAAVAKYGDDGKNGIVSITTKKGKKNIKTPLYIVDGKKTSKKDADNLDVNSFDNISVLKGKSAIAKYGEAGKNGVIIVTTKKN